MDENDILLFMHLCTIFDTVICIALPTIWCIGHVLGMYYGYCKPECVSSVLASDTNILCFTLSYTYSPHLVNSWFTEWSGFIGVCSRGCQAWWFQVIVV